MIDVSKYVKNTRKKQVVASVGSFGQNMPFGTQLVAGTSYKITAIPQDALVTAVSLVVTEAFPALTTVDIGTTDVGFDLGNDLDCAAIAVVAGDGAGMYSVVSDVIVTVSGTLTTVGKAQVVIEYVEVNTDLAMSVE
jgi:hypothetical protein